MRNKSWLKSGRLERVEAAYLQALRVAGLLIATLCLIAALFFAGNALWRLTVSTDVKPEQTAVNTANIAQKVVNTEDASTAVSSGSTDTARQVHDAFKKDVWPKYYAIYDSAFQNNRNRADSKVSSDDMMAQMGYDLDTYKQAYDAEGEFGSERIIRMVTDPSYQSAALKHVTEVMGSNAVKAKLNSYKAATKSEQKCSSTPRSVYVSRICGNYYYSYECGSTQTVYDRQCEAVFPDSIITPAIAFARADVLFAIDWLSDEETKAAIANAEREERMLTRAGIGPNLQLALVIIAGFFVVMFFFLLVAIERHLRPHKAEAS